MSKFPIKSSNSDEILENAKQALIREAGGKTKAGSLNLREAQETSDSLSRFSPQDLLVAQVNLHQDSPLKAAQILQKGLSNLNLTLDIPTGDTSPFSDQILECLHTLPTSPQVNSAEATLTKPDEQRLAGPIYREPFNLNKFTVATREECERLTPHKHPHTFDLAGHPAELVPGTKGGPGVLKWRGREYSTRDYKGRELLAPNQQMWGWFQQRTISEFSLPRAPELVAEMVVFGPRDDHYTFFPEKFGFMRRRSIKEGAPWSQRKDTYNQRLTRLNPRRGKLGGKLYGLLSRPFGKEQSSRRINEIQEESGLRIKHAPAILMLNRFIVEEADFVAAYLSGSQGIDPEGSQGIARPDHITDHELYRMFSGKHRRRILNRTIFANKTTLIHDPDKHLNRWFNKNQFSRWWRIFTRG